MTKSPRKNVPDVGTELGAACMPSELASDQATAPGLYSLLMVLSNQNLFRIDKKQRISSAVSQIMKKDPFLLLVMVIGYC